MAIKLEKGQRINLEKNNGSKLTIFALALIGVPLKRKDGSVQRLQKL